MVEPGISVLLYTTTVLFHNQTPSTHHHHQSVTTLTVGCARPYYLNLHIGLNNRAESIWKISILITRMCSIWADWAHLAEGDDDDARHSARGVSVCISRPLITISSVCFFPNPEFLPSHPSSIHTERIETRRHKRPNG